jgi:hypothetical protein
MIKKLASIKLTFITLASLLALLGIGTGLTYSQGHAETIGLISDTTPLDWFLAAGHGDRVVLVWFVATCVAAAVLFINTIACIGLHMARRFQNNGFLRKCLFILVHVMFAVVLLCHGLGMIFGYKYSSIEMWRNDSFGFEGGYELTVGDIIFRDDATMLEADYKTRRSMLTRERFHPENNSAAVTLKYKGRIIRAGKVCILAPMVADGIQITLTDFIVNGDKSETPIGISLVVTKNPITPLFFTSYVVLIFSLIGLVIMTWRPRYMHNQFSEPLSKHPGSVKVKADRA